MNTTTLVRRAARLLAQLANDACGICGYWKCRCK